MRGERRAAGDGDRARSECDEAQRIVDLPKDIVALGDAEVVVDPCQRQHDETLLGGTSAQRCKQRGWDGKHEEQVDVLGREAARGNRAPGLLDGVFQDAVGQSLVGEVEDPEDHQGPQDGFHPAGQHGDAGDGRLDA